MAFGIEEQKVSCPFCGESIEILLDLSGGDQSYIEDCQVCCRPMLIRFDIDAGNLSNLRVDRVS